MVLLLFAVLSISDTPRNYLFQFVSKQLSSCAILITILHYAGIGISLSDEILTVNLQNLSCNELKMCCWLP